MASKFSPSLTCEIDESPTHAAPKNTNNNKSATRVCAPLPPSLSVRPPGANGANANTGVVLLSGATDWRGSTGGWRGSAAPPDRQLICKWPQLSARHCALARGPFHPRKIWEKGARGHKGDVSQSRSATLENASWRRIARLPKDARNTEQTLRSMKCVAMGWPPVEKIS